jgi:hypothetical protein
MARSSSSRPEDEGLRDIVARIIDTRRMEPRISPSWVATEAMLELDPVKIVERRDPLIYTGCHLQLRQIARALLAKRFDPIKDDGLRDDLFPELQWRYPTARSAYFDEPEYLLRDLMGTDDVEYNVGRLRAEADAKNKHADALEAWHRRRN